jgi:spermidine/putrescine transport system permease protein
MKGEGKAGWILIKLLTVLVYVFMFAPILVVLVLSFNASQFGGFPMTGFSLHWYGRLFENEAVVRAFQTSLWIGLLTAVVCTAIGIMAAMALVRYEFPGKQWINALIVGPILVPETVLGVGLLLANRWIGMKPNYGLLLAGRILVSLPYVVLIVLARLFGV